ncbi:DUF4373 domain-containing protein [uncultured Bacteroides sp.]|uniref:DUF4373 domain-containing protein n=1 Tax=uncultured Bacteroides sp. TaxID=162156 RepID=UPI002AA7D4C0|nr:DUF4373 domain-containing protein [uncultured Bacteroides sp.]
MNNYFSHDNNARNDDKIIAVRMKYGAEGYGIYFMILERLMESTDYMSIKDYNIIAFDLRVDASKIKSIIEDFGLFVFTEDGKYFYSESFNRRMIPLNNMREQRRLAGKKSAEKRAKNGSNLTTVERPLHENPTKKEKKEIKENKKEIYKEKNPLSISPDILNLSEKSLEECFNEIKANQSWRETLCMNTRIRDRTFMPADFDQYLKQFFRKLANEGETKKSPKDAMSHFARWLSIEIKNKSNEKAAIKNQRDSEQRKNDSITAISTTVMEAAEKRRAELEAEGII